MFKDFLSPKMIILSFIIVFINSGMATQSCKTFQSVVGNHKPDDELIKDCISEEGMLISWESVKGLHRTIFFYSYVIFTIYVNSNLL